MFKAFMVLGALFVALACSPAAQSANMSFSVTPLGGSQWRYDYFVAADAVTPLVEEFTIFFDRSLFDGLAIASTPSGWDSIAIQSDLGLPANGYVDSLALGAGLSAGPPLTGLAVTFTYLGTGMPGAQAFEVVNPSTFAVIGAGATTPLPSVPEPANASLLLCGSVALLAFRRRFFERNAASARSVLRARGVSAVVGQQ